MGLGSSVALERLSAAVTAAGSDAATARRVATTVLHYVLGFVWHEQQRLQYDSAGARPESAGGAGADLAAADATSGDFAFGLDLIVAGLRART